MSNDYMNYGIDNYLDEISNPNNEKHVTTCEKCNSKIQYSTVDQVMGFRDEEILFCPKCSNVLRRSRWVDFVDENVIE